MKYACILLHFCVCLSFYSYSQGSTCSNAIVLTMDGVCRNFATSSSTGANVVCTDNGNSPITWFSFTTNATPNNILINITDPSGQPSEIAMYTACTGSNPLQIGSSMCFEDGQGLWAPEELFNLTPNTTYKLRVKTATATTLSVCAKHYTPPNDNCAGATSISETAIIDNNACHKGGPGVWASDLCANTLENTAFYTYYVLNTGSTIVNISGIACDNGNGNNSNGFQMGFFTGNCASLVPFYCTSGSGSVVQATTPSLTAGTKVTLAIDGYAGSNCQYNIQALNAFVLSAHVKNLTAWKQNKSNLVTWKLDDEKNLKQISLQRSTDGISFENIVIISPQQANNYEKTYSHEDKNPFINSYYRLQLSDIAGKLAMSETVTVRRTDNTGIKLHFANLIHSSLTAKIETAHAGKYEMQITGMNGTVFHSSIINCKKDITHFERDLSFLQQGNYFLSLQNENGIITKPFFKIH